MNIGPLVPLFAHHSKPLILGALLMVVCYALFYITTVFSLSYGVGTLHIPRPQFLGMLGSGSTILITTFLCLELFLMGCTFAPMGALLPELFPTSVRYTGAGAAYNLGGILGASLAPYIAQQLVQHGGLSWVGGYISVAAVISVIAALLVHETRDRELV